MKIESYLIDTALLDNGIHYDMWKLKGQFTQNDRQNVRNSLSRHSRSLNLSFSFSF